MENNSTGGNDKRSWRDRLGIGTKELPRIAEEFKSPDSAAKTVITPMPGLARPAPRPAQPVVKPAPMAPRATPKLETKPDIRSETRSETRPETRIAPPANNDALAERLKSQREAAEKLAEQRVQAARQKAENAANLRSQAKEAPKLPTDVVRPKFSFAEEEASRNRPTELPALPRRMTAKVTASVAPPKSMSAPTANISPPRPALGVDRPPMPARSAALQKDATTVAPSNGFRPLDPSVGYTPPQPIFPQRQYTAPPVAPVRNQASTRPPYYAGSTPTQPAELAAPEVPFEAPNNRIPPRPPLRGPMSGPGGVPSGSYADDVFEQHAQRPQRRIAAGDYQNAYRDSDLGYEYEQPKSSAPWVLLLLLLLAGALAAAGAWFYETQMKGQALAPATATQQNVPAVEPPTAAAKTVPEQPLPTTDAPEAVQPAQGSSVVPATTKKQIYDRIVGDREVLGGQMVPTEETPVVPDQNAAPVAEDAMAPEPDQQPITDDTAPLPLPPPPGQTGEDQQGLLDAEPGKTINQASPNEAIPAAGANQAAETSLDQVIEPVEGESKDVQGLAKAAEEVAAVNDQIPQANTGATIEPPPASPPAAINTGAETVKPLQPLEPLNSTETELVSDEPAASPAEAKVEATVEPTPVPKPTKAKVVKLAQKKKSATPVRKVSNDKSLVLVPEQSAAAAQSSNGEGNILYGDTQTAAAPQPAKRRTLFDLLGNKKSNAQPAENNDQVASIAAPRKQVVQPKETLQASPTGDFVAQLASFRTQQEANSEFARMRSRHGAIIGGMSPIVSKVTVAGSSRYRLAVGPMANRAAANRVCSQLLSAGERDCITKQR